MICDPFRRASGGIDLASGKNLGDQVWMSLARALAAAALFIDSRYSRSRKR